MTDPKVDILCYCFNVAREDVLNFMRTPGATVEKLIETTSIGTRCTACLLDTELALAEVQSPGGLRELHKLEVRSDRRTAFAVRQKVVDSGFFVNDGRISTSIQVANYGPMFEASNSVIAYRGTLKVFDNSGMQRAKLAFTVERDSETGIHFADIKDVPAQGWFLLRLKPLAAGLFGSTRAQVLLRSHRWAASYHTQPNAYRRRTQVVIVGAWLGKLNTIVSIINCSPRPASVRVGVADMSSLQYSELVIPILPRGAAIADLDELMPKRHWRGHYLVSLNSAVGTRNHIINRNPDGSWSVDHFPNPK